jgi:uncharacterized membrane protein YbhN (UPF0104 family)
MPSPASGWSRAWRVLRGIASVALAAVLLVLLLPRVTGARWSQIGDQLARLSTGQLLALAAVWLIGLWFYTFVLTGSVPGLRHDQALTVNVTTSAVSNLIPFGGAAGLALTFGMLRTWGFSAPTVALSALVTGIWNVLAKLALPLLALVGLLIAGDAATHRLAAAAATGAAVLGLALGVLAGALSSEGFAIVVGRTAQGVGHAGLRLARSPRRLAWDQGVPRWRHQVIGLVRTGWSRLTFGLVGFLGSQAVLLYLSLHALGSSLGPAQVFAGYAFGRLLSTLVITPGGLGITETGAAGLLTAFGGDSAVCASGVLLFSGFAFFAEFPAGALGYLVWLGRRSWRREITHGVTAGMAPGAGPETAPGMTDPR